MASFGLGHTGSLVTDEAAIWVLEPRGKTLSPGVGFRVLALLTRTSTHNPPTQKWWPLGRRASHAQKIDRRCVAGVAGRYTKMWNMQAICCARVGLVNTVDGGQGGTTRHDDSLAILDDFWLWGTAGMAPVARKAILN